LSGTDEGTSSGAEVAIKRKDTLKKNPYRICKEEKDGSSNITRSEVFLDIVEDHGRYI
jgi:hypothetical protein